MDLLYSTLDVHILAGAPWKQYYGALVTFALIVRALIAGFGPPVFLVTSPTSVDGIFFGTSNIWKLGESDSNIFKLF